MHCQRVPSLLWVRISCVIAVSLVVSGLPGEVSAWIGTQHVIKRRSSIHCTPVLWRHRQYTIESAARLWSSPDDDVMSAYDLAMAAASSPQSSQPEHESAPSHSQPKVPAAPTSPASASGAPNRAGAFQFSQAPPPRATPKEPDPATLWKPTKLEQNALRYKRDGSRISTEKPNPAAIRQLQKLATSSEQNGPSTTTMNATPPPRQPVPTPLRRDRRTPAALPQPVVSRPRLDGPNNNNRAETRASAGMQPSFSPASLASTPPPSSPKTSTSTVQSTPMSAVSKAVPESLPVPQTGQEQLQKPAQSAPMDSTVREQAPVSPAVERKPKETIAESSSMKPIAKIEPQTMVSAVETLEDDSKYDIVQTIATIQTCLVGAAVGMVAIAPITAFHHFFAFPSYEGLSQWEWDTGAAAIQGAVFAAVYRYSLRQDLTEVRIRRGVFAAFLLVRSLVVIKVPMSCTALPLLQCGAPLEVLDWDMMGQLSMATVESYVLFGVVGAAMDYLLGRALIEKFPT